MMNMNKELEGLICLRNAVKQHRQIDLADMKLILRDFEIIYAQILWMKHQMERPELADLYAKYLVARQEQEG